jgi:hypothetical protein
MNTMITIQKIQFFTPAMVTYTNEDGVTAYCEVSVDYKEKKVLIPSDAPSELVDLFFPFLDASLKMPDNSFEASKEVYQKARSAKMEFDTAHKEHIGEDDAQA